MEKMSDEQFSIGQLILYVAARSLAVNLHRMQIICMEHQLTLWPSGYKDPELDGSDLTGVKLFDFL